MKMQLGKCGQYFLNFLHCEYKISYLRFTLWRDDGISCDSLKTFSFQYAAMNLYVYCASFQSTCLTCEHFWEKDEVEKCVMLHIFSLLLFFFCCQNLYKSLRGSPGENLNFFCHTENSIKLDRPSQRAVLNEDLYSLIINQAQKRNRSHCLTSVTNYKNLQTATHVLHMYGCTAYCREDYIR